MNFEQNNNTYDARFSGILGGTEYDDLLIALEFYNEFQAETGVFLKEYISKNLSNSTGNIKVLEAGPGTGITTLELIKADPRVKIESVDNEEKMLDAVREKFSKYDELKDKVNFIHADILQYLQNTPDESFDAFASVYTLHNFEPDFRRKVIELISKKLKKGGVFINGDKYAQSEELHTTDIQNEIKNYDKFDVAANKAEQNGDLDKAEHYRRLKREWIEHTWQDNKVRITLQEQIDMLKELGFDSIEIGNRYDLVTTVKAIKI